MRIPRTLAILVALHGMANWPAIPVYAGDSAPKPEELVARHLDSIGSADARAAVETRRPGRRARRQWSYAFGSRSACLRRLVLE